MIPIPISNSPDRSKSLYNLSQEEPCAVEMMKHFYTLNSVPRPATSYSKATVALRQTSPDGAKHHKSIDAAAAAAVHFWLNHSRASPVKPGDFQRRRGLVSKLNQFLTSCDNSVLLDNRLYPSARATDILESSALTYSRINKNLRNHLKRPCTLNSAVARQVQKAEVE